MQWNPGPVVEVVRTAPYGVMVATGGGQGQLISRQKPGEPGTFQEREIAFRRAGRDVISFRKIKLAEAADLQAQGWAQTDVDLVGAGQSGIFKQLP